MGSRRKQGRRRPLSPSAAAGTDGRTDVECTVSPSFVKRPAGKGQRGILLLPTLPRILMSYYEREREREYTVGRLKKRELATEKSKGEREGPFA